MGQYWSNLDSTPTMNNVKVKSVIASTDSITSTENEFDSSVRNWMDSQLISTKTQWNLWENNIKKEWNLLENNMKREYRLALQNPGSSPLPATTVSLLALMNAPRPFG